MSIRRLSDHWVQDVVKFWFEDLSSRDWFVRDEKVDQDITVRFSDLFASLSQDIPPECHTLPEAALAAIIVLDQFSRNMFRDLAKTFETDDRALALAQETIGTGFDQQLARERRQFIYMPFMHSEDPEVQKVSVELFTKLGNENNLKFAVAHKDIIDRFGRYPHRNEVLGRESTPDEIKFLTQPGSSF